MASITETLKRTIVILKDKLDHYGAVDPVLASEMEDTIEGLHYEIMEECTDNSALWETNCEILFETVVEFKELVKTAFYKITILQTENSDEKKRVKELEERVKELEEKVERLLKKIERMESDQHKLVLGQMAFEIDKAVAKTVLDPVLPVHYIQSIEDMESELEGRKNSVFFGSEGDRLKAEESWTKLQKQFSWNPTLRYYMKTLKRNRVSSAHPDINEKTIDIAMRKKIPEKERGLFKQLFKIYQELVEE